MSESDKIHRQYALVLIFAVTAIAAAKVCSVEQVWEPSRFPGPRREWPATRPQPTPTLGSNDRSRWLTVRALVDHGTFVIGRRIVPNDPSTDQGLAFEDGWKTVDKVKDPVTHYYYSSKPPLLAIIVAGEYWLLKNCFGLSITKNQWPVTIIILLTVNVIPLFFVLVYTLKYIEQSSGTDFARAVTCVTACLGTFSIAFVNTLNNHLPALYCVALSIYFTYSCYRTRSELINYTPESSEQRDRLTRLRILFAGLFASFAASFELPATAFCLIAGLIVIWTQRGRVLWFLAGCLIPILISLAANYAAFGRLTPIYGEFGGPWYNYPGSHWQLLENVQRGEFVPGIDFATEPRWVYLLHCLLGHHGWFSLSPIWLVGLLGITSYRELVISIKDRRLHPIQIVFMAYLLTCVLVIYYVFIWRTNNYGGNSSGLRWFFWLTPLWIIAVHDGLSRLRPSRFVKSVVMLLLGLSIFSVFYPAANPWRSPWLLVLMEYLDWVNYDRP